MVATKNFGANFISTLDSNASSNLHYSKRLFPLLTILQIAYPSSFGVPSLNSSMNLENIRARSRRGIV